MSTYPVDLHTHSIRSDGNDTVEELIEFAVAAGCRAIALTDHDMCFPDAITLRNGQEVEPVSYAASRGLILIPGIEISCDTNVDDVHIVGLGCDGNHPAMRAAEEFAKQSKVRGYRKLTEVLCENGIMVTWEDVKNSSDPPRRDDEVQRKHIFETIARKGYCASWSEAKLMVRDNPTFNVKREKIDPLKAIETIHAAGGLAILAHPWLIDELIPLQDVTVTRQAYIDRLVDAGLDGIEGAYPYEKTSYKWGQTREEVEAIVRQRYGDRLRIISGGSDYHDDGRKGVKNPRRLGEGGVSWEYFSSHPLFQRFLPQA